MFQIYADVFHAVMKYTYIHTSYIHTYIRTYIHTYIHTAKIKQFMMEDKLSSEIFLLTTVSRTALRPTQPPIQWVPGAPSLGLKPLGREADQSPPPSAEVKECVELYLHSPNMPSWRGA
jgi:hypothetical protein